MARLLTADDLVPRAREALEAAYADDKGRRPKCSTDDFAAGWVAALVRYGVSNLFDPEAWREAHA
jgi:hypothetical protein